MNSQTQDPEYEHPEYDETEQDRSESDDQETEDQADQEAMERIRARYLKRMRLGISFGIGFIILLAYVLRP